MIKGAAAAAAGLTLYPSNTRAQSFLPAINLLLLDDPVEIPLGKYVTVTPVNTAACSSSPFGGYAGSPSELTKVGTDTYQLSDMDIGYFFGDYMASGEFKLGADGKTLTLQGKDESTYNIAWRGTGTYYADAGMYGMGRLEFLCYYDATYAGPNAVSSVWFDKMPEFLLPLGTYTTVVPTDSCQLSSYAGASSTLSWISPDVYQLSDMDIGYFIGDYIASGEFKLGSDNTTLTLQGSESTYGIAWRGTGTYYPGGGVNGKGRIEFLCYYDATFGRPAGTESIWFDKD